MIEISLTKSECKHGAILGLDRMLEVVGPKQTHKYYENIQGALAEMAAAKALNISFPWSINTFHTESDLPHGIEVRWSKKRDRSLYFRKGDNPEGRFVLVTGESPTFLVKGWAWGQEVIDYGHKLESSDKYQRDAWGMPGDKLHSIDTLQLPSVAEREIYQFSERAMLNG